MIYGFNQLHFKSMVLINFISCDFCSSVSISQISNKNQSCRQRTVLLLFGLFFFVFFFLLTSFYVFFRVEKNSKLNIIYSIKSCFVCVCDFKFTKNSRSMVLINFISCDFCSSESISQISNRNQSC